MRLAALIKRRRSAALRYFRAPVGPYRLIPASACGRIAASPETEWPKHAPRLVRVGGGYSITFSGTTQSESSAGSAVTG